MPSGGNAFKRSSSLNDVGEDSRAVASAEDTAIGGGSNAIRSTAVATRPRSYSASDPRSVLWAALQGDVLIDSRPLNAHSPSNSRSLSRAAIAGTRNSQSQISPDSRERIQANLEFSKQIADLARLTDQVLTLRHGLVNEEEALDRQQAYLHESTQALMNAFTENLPRPRPKKKKEEKKKEGGEEEDMNFAATSVEDGANTTPTGRLNLDAEDASLADTADLVLGPSIDSRAVKAEGVPTEVNSNVKVILKDYRKYQSAYESLNLQKAKVKMQRTELTNSEYRLRCHQLEFAKDLERMSLKRADAGTSAATKPLLVVTPEPGSEQSQNDIPPQLAAYYDRKADVGIYTERLMEHDYWYSEGMVERDFMADRGDPLDVPLEQFEAEYWSLRQKIEEDLHDAERDVQKLAEECHALGIEIENIRKTTPSAVNSISPDNKQEPRHEKGRLEDYQPDSWRILEDWTPNSAGLGRIPAWLDDLYDDETGL